MFQTKRTVIYLKSSLISLHLKKFVPPASNDLNNIFAADKWIIVIKIDINRKYIYC